MLQLLRQLVLQLSQDEAHGGLLSLETLRLLDQLRRELSREHAT